MGFYRNDTLIGGGGKDTFVYEYTHDGNDTITDFKVGTDADADVLDLRDLLNFNEGDNINIGDYIKVSDTDNSLLEIDANGLEGGFTSDVSIDLVGIDLDLNTMIADGNIIL